MESENIPKSSFPTVTYTGVRGLPLPTVNDWLKVKRRDDNIGPYWRVHDKLYDLTDFIEKHPGGRDWIEFSKGIDITEAFEASHIESEEKALALLAKYYVKDATTRRNSPYTFKENGFYKTLKGKAKPILKKVGTEPSSDALLIQDCLALSYVVTILLGVWMDIVPLQLAAGVLLGMCAVGAHNMFHKKDSWRRFYFDLSPLSSYEWRISHAFSHHFYPNTVFDFEIQLAEPLVELLPNRRRNFRQKYLAPIYVELLFLFHGLSQILSRSRSILLGKQKFRPENGLILAQLLIFMWIAPSIWVAVRGWMIICMVSTLWLVVGGQHHHPLCFHDGDKPRSDPDFGLCQLDATKGKNNWYHKSLFSILVSFGEHPLHHLFPTVCHSKLKYLKPVLEETLHQFSEEFPLYSQLELFLGTRQQIRREKPHEVPVHALLRNVHRRE